MQTGETLIEVKDLCKHFRDGTVKALDGVDLTIRKGDVIVIIGPSGSGKSTFLRSLNLLETPTSGSVIVEGTDITKKKNAQGKKIDLDAHRRKMGMVFQHFNLFPHKTVLENLTISPILVKKADKAAAKAKAVELLERVGLADRADAYPSQLSGGQKQRVAIVRALAMEPDVMLFDEPTSALDPTTTQSILSLLKEINRTMGVTVIVITHEMRVIDQICDRVAVIDRGQIAELGAVSQVFTNPQSKIARELILPGVSIAPVFTPGGKRIRLAFNGETTRHPVVASLIMECQAPVNIVSADIREIDGKIYGQTILELPADEASAERARAWLKQDGVSFEEV